jgi:NAD(P) transhydrogenase subunit alpha
MTSVFVPRERAAQETRVAATPETVRRLVGRGFAVTLEGGAGEASGFADREYAAAGATIAADRVVAWGTADLVLEVGPPGDEEIDLLATGAVVVGLLGPHDGERARRLAARGVTALAMELIPRVTRAQGMDALSSQASIAGYKAVLLGAAACPRLFPMMTTAAGTVRPARVVVLGAGVAGLQALATARRLGAVVEVSDIRPAVEEQVESLGGRFIELPGMESGEGQGGYAREMGEEFLSRQRAILTERLRGADVVITTALVPGKRAPVLLTAEMVAAMKPGAVVVDLAAEQGGNCQHTRLGEEVEVGGVRILGPHNLATTVPHDASLLYARNVAALVEHLTKDGKLVVDRSDEIAGPALLTLGGEVLFGSS